MKKAVKKLNKDTSTTTPFLYINSKELKRTKKNNTSTHLL